MDNKESNILKLKEKLRDIQNEIHVHKGQRNNFGNYNYRSAEDILEAVKPFEKQYNVLFQVTENLTVVNDYIAIESRAVIHDLDSESTLMSTGTAIIDFDAKGMQHPQRTGAASSYAKKYALGNLLLLDDTKDADAINDHGKGAKKEKPVLTKTHDRYQGAIKALGEGKTTIEQIKSKFVLGPGVEESFKKVLLLDVK